MKNLIFGCFLLSLTTACGSTKDADKKTEEKAKTETPKPQKSQVEYEKM